MTTVDAYDDDIVVAPESRMEEGLASDSDSFPLAEAVVAEPVPANSSVTTHALTGSNRFVPVVVASALADHPTLSSSEDEDEKRPDLLSATVIKRSRDAKVGIVLMDTNSGVALKRIEPVSLFSASLFEVGDLVMSVNGESCEGLDSKEVADLIRNAEGILTVLVRAPNGRADMVSSMVMKERPDARVGIGFKCDRGKLVISSIAENGIFAHSLLNVSDTCLSINDTKCTSDMDAASAANLIKASPSFITITAKTRHETGVVVAVSAVSTPADVSNTAMGANGSTSIATPTQQQGLTLSQKRGCTCAIGIFIMFVIIIVVIVINGNRNDYFNDCSYIYCTECGLNCYSKFCWIPTDMTLLVLLSNNPLVVCFAPQL